MRLDNKGQASVELIFATMIFLVIAGGMIQLASSEMNKADTGNLGQARMIGEKIAGTINMVYTNGPGYSSNLILPNFPNSTATYNIYVYSNGNMNVIYNGNNITIKLIPKNVQSFTMSNNVSNVNGTTYNVRNDNGTIKFT